MTKTYHLVALPGEGIGPEVVDAALQVLDSLAQAEGFAIHVTHGLIGEPSFQTLGSHFHKQTAQLCEGSDGVLLGAVSRGGLLELRHYFDFFANLRPVRVFESLIEKSSLKPELIRGVDILFVRELASGIYFGPAGRAIDERGSYGYHTMKYYDWEIARIAQVALQKAQQRRRKLTVAHKSNALPELQWVEIVHQEALAYPDVQVEMMLVDNLAMQIAFKPRQFDVILAGNLFGDILSDLGGTVVGSIGLLGSASLNAEGFGLYEPIHGTAPDITGNGVANPIGTLEAIGLMLQQWGEIVAAKRLAAIQQKVLEQGYRTLDLYPTKPEIFVTTSELTDLLIQAIHN
jgi:3-isopropylmalate dehydrogenase